MEQIYRDNAQIVYHFIYKKCHDRGLAEEITQETFLRAMQSMERYDHSCKLSVWLCSIANHIYLQQLRKYGREVPMEEAGELPEARENVEKKVMDKCELEEVLSWMEELSPQMRRVLHLRAAGELSFKEIGEIMGKSENWARVTFYRGKEFLLKKKDEGGTEEGERENLQGKGEAEKGRSVWKKREGDGKEGGRYGD